MTFISSAVCIALAVWTLSIFSKCKNAKKAKDAAGILLVVTVGGIVGLLATTACAAVVIMRLDDPKTAGSAYITFLAVAGGFTLVILLLTFVASLMRNRWRTLRLVVSYLGALTVNLVVAPLVSMLVTLFGVEINMYVEVASAFMALVFFSLSAFEMRRFYKNISTPEGLSEYLAELDFKKKMKRRRRII